MGDARYYIGFSHARGIGAVRLRLLLAAFGDLQSAWEASESALGSAGLGPSLVQSIAEARRRVDLVEEMARLEAQGVRTICWENQDEETHELLLRHHPGGELQIRAMLAQWRLQAEDHGDFDLSPEHLATISAKTLLVWGDRDDLFPVELALEMYRAIPNSALWVAPGQGHDPFPEILPAFPATVMAFFGENWPA